MLPKGWAIGQLADELFAGQQGQLDAAMEKKLKPETRRELMNAFNKAYLDYLAEYGSIHGTPEDQAPKYWMPSALTVARIWLKYE